MLPKLSNKSFCSLRAAQQIDKQAMEKRHHLIIQLKQRLKNNRQKIIFCVRLMENIQTAAAVANRKRVKRRAVLFA